MALLDGLEKLINEHGSAVILKERIELANDKYSMLEQKFLDAQARIKKLEGDNSRLRTDLIQAQNDIKQLRQNTQNSLNVRLEEVREKILIFMKDRPETLVSKIIEHIGLPEQLVEFHLTDLANEKFIHYSTPISIMGKSRPSAYALTQEGRRYLTIHGLFA